MSKKLIPAVGYLRKSTKGRQKDGKQRQEKSIPQQKREISELAKRHGYVIVRWYVDEASGWKRGGKRPGFERMLNDAKENRDFQTVLCDDLDRFSRAEVMEVFSDLSTLSSAGVKTIHCVNQGKYGLGDNDIGKIIKMVVDVHGGNEFSRKLSRRVTLARRNAALEGKRSGGPTPYAMVSDGNGGLKPGKRSEVKTLQWIFDQFVTHRRSINWITKELNRKEVPSPRGGPWRTTTLNGIIRRAAYKGDFQFNKTHQGRFFRIDDKREVSEITDPDAKGAVLTKRGVYKPIIDPKLFDAAQKRLATLGGNRSRRKRVGYPLSGILVCDHCGRNLYGCTPHATPVYRCGNPAKTGLCKQYQVRQDEMLPFVMELLSKEIIDLKALLTLPPEELTRPRKAKREQREQLQTERDRLARQIAQAEENILFIEDARTRKSLDARISGLRDELDGLDAKLAEEAADVFGYTVEELENLNEWWTEFEENAVSIPLKPNMNVPVHACFYADPFSEGTAVLVDSRIVNDMLHTLGAEVRLRWKTEEYTTSGGIVRQRHVLARGRFRLGQRNGNLQAVGFDTSGFATWAWHPIPHSPLAMPPRPFFSWDAC